MGSGESGEQGSTARSGGVEAARRRNPILSALLAAGLLALAAGVVYFIWVLMVVAGMQRGHYEGPHVVNATDQTIIVERETLGEDVWHTAVELEPGERGSVTIACGGRAQVRALDTDGELVAATELKAGRKCSGEWVIEADG